MLVREGGRSRALDVTLAYREYSGRAKRPTGTGWEVRQRLHTGDLETGTTFGFTLGLPDDALPGFACSARGTRLRWEVCAQSDEVGRDTSVAVPLPVSDQRDAHRKGGASGR